MELTFLGNPKIDKKENHKIIKVVVKNGITERSKDLFEKEYSFHLDNQPLDSVICADSIKLFKKNNKVEQRSYYLFCYEHTSHGSWKRLSGGYLHNYNA